MLTSFKNASFGLTARINELARDLKRHWFDSNPGTLNSETYAITLSATAPHTTNLW